MQYVGKVAVRVWPDTRAWDREERRINGKKLRTTVEAVTNFAEALRKKNELGKNERFQLEADIKKARANLDRIRDDIYRTKSLAEDRIRLRIEAKTNELGVLKREMSAIQAAAAKRNVILMDIRDAKKKLDQLKKQKEAFGSGTSAKLDVDITAAQNKIKALSKRYDALNEQVSHRGKVQVDIREAMERIQTLKREMKFAGTKATMHLELEKRRAEEQLRDLTKKREVTLQADLDAAHARAQLATVARTRFVNLAVRVTGLTEAKAAIEAATGVAMVKRARDALTNFATNIDRVLIKFAVLGSTIGMLGVAVIKLVPGLLNVVGGLVKIAKGANVAVGAIAGLVAVAYTAVVAFRDMDKAASASAKAMLDLKHRIGDEMEEVRSIIREGFWDAVDVAPFAELTDKVFPQIKSGAQEVSSALGGLFSDLGKRLNDITTNDSLTPMFNNIAEAVRRLSPFVQDVTEGVARLALIGSKRLPAMSDAVSALAKRFRDWAADEQRVNKAIDESVKQMKYLWTAATSLVRVFTALTKASNEVTGASGLSGVADGIKRIADAMNNPYVQTGLRHMFVGADQAVKNFKNQLPPLEEALRGLTDGLGTVAPAAGNAFGALLNGALTVANNPVFQSGLADLFNGIAEGLKSIDWDNAATKMGDLMTTLGEVAANLGPIADTIINVFLDIANGLADATEKLSGFVAEHPNLINALVAIAAAAGAAAVALKGLSAIEGVTSALGGLSTIIGGGGEAAAGGGLLGGLRGMIPALSGIGGTVAIVAAAVAAAAIIFKLMWDNSEGLRTALGNIWAMLQEQFAPVIQQFKDELLPAFKDAWVNLLPALQEFWGFMGDMLAPVLQMIATVVIPLVVGSIKAFMTVLTTLIQISNGVVSGIKGHWNDLKQSASMIFNGLKGIIQGIWEGIKGIMTGLAHGSVSEVVGAFRGMWGKVSSAFSMLRAGILGALQSLAGAMADAGRAIIQALVNGIKSMASHAINAAKSIVQGIRNLLPHSPAKEGPFSGSGWGGWGESIVDELTHGLKVRENAPAQATAKMLDNLAGSLSMSQTGYKAGESFSEALAKGIEDGGRGIERAVKNISPDLSQTTLKFSAEAMDGNTVGGTVVNQNFNTKIYRSDDDLYTAAPIMHRTAAREARRIT